MLMRKCGCGVPAAPGGECEECKNQRLGHGGQSDALFHHSFSQVSVLERSAERPQAELAISSPGDRYEQEADRAAEHATRLPHLPAAVAGSLTWSPVRIQRKEAGEEFGAPPVPGLLVDDNIGHLNPGQMCKGDFLAELKDKLFHPKDASFAAAAEPDNRSQIESVIGSYQRKSAAEVEKAICEYAPEASRATSASEYVGLISDRLKRQGGGAGVASITGTLTEIASRVAGGIGSAFARLGGVFAKARDGGVRGNASPQAIQSQLGPGQPLQSGVRSRMEAAFGHDFSRVRVYADSRAATLSSNLNARAFTVGSQVAFAAGEYRPGTAVGDALIAHELAHVVQQRGAPAQAPAMQPEPASAAYGALEEDADVSAVHAMLSTWGRIKLGAKAAKGRALPSLRSGLRLQRCPQQCAQPKQHEENILHPAQTTEGFNRSPSPQTEYERYVAEGTQSLLGKGKPLGKNKSVPGTISFGLPWETDPAPWDMDRNTNKEPPPCNSKDYANYYDTAHWQLVDENHRCALETRGNSADAIAAIFDENRSSQWQIDCGMFTQLPHYYALLRLWGRDRFTKQFPTIRLRKEFSTGLRSSRIWIEGSKPHWLVPAQQEGSLGHPKLSYETVSGRKVPVKVDNAREVPEDEVLKQVPVGTRVNFSIQPLNRSIPSIDNTIKMGPNLYGGHAVTEGKSDLYTKEEICQRIARKETQTDQNVKDCHVTLVDVRYDPTKEKQ
jgi:hypothetical protein